MKLVDQIRQALDKVLKEMGFPEVEFMVQHPAEEKFGDYSSNVALRLATLAQGKLLGKNPREIAEAIANKLRVDPTSLKLRGVKVAGPGFINISINIDYFVSEIERVLKSGSNYGNGALWQGKRIVVEYTDPNPFKEFHIGHLYNTTVGETLARLFEANGATVWRADFFGDVGMHAAKAIYGLREKMKKEKWKMDELAKKPLPERVKIMGQAYAMGATAYEDPSTGSGQEAKEEMKRLNLLIFVAAQEYWRETKGWEPRIDYRSHIKRIDEDELQEIKKLWVTGRQWSLDYFETLYERLGTKLDGYYPESLTGEWGYDFVMQGLKSGVFVRSEGAVVYMGEKHGFHTRVFINKLGLPTYETKDIGNAPMKMNDFAYDKSLIVTGGEIIEYFKVVIAAMKEVNPELGNKTEHLGHGMVRLPEGKMSSRTGKIVTGDSLLAEAKQKVLEVMRKGELLDQEKNEVADMVSVGAVKYAFLKSGIGKDISFSFEESVSFEGNSGPYLQYTHARARSVLRKAQLQGVSLKAFKDTPYRGNDEELLVLRWIARYPEVIEKACQEYAPNQVCTYLFELGQRFNTFYNKHSILGKTQNEFSNSNFQFSNKSKIQNPKSENDQEEQTRNFRLALTAATAQVLKNGLGVLGIEAPEKM